MLTSTPLQTTPRPPLTPPTIPLHSHLLDCRPNNHTTATHTHHLLATSPPSGTRPKLTTTLTQRAYSLATEYAVSNFGNKNLLRLQLHSVPALTLGQICCIHRGYLITNYPAVITTCELEIYIGFEKLNTFDISKLATSH